MKLKKLNLKQNKLSKKLSKEDLRFLQKRISGKSVYRSLSSVYSRYPKHRNRHFGY